MKLIGYFKVAHATTGNIILNALTLCRYVWRKGRVRRGVFKNWAERFRFRPANFVQPTTEAEIVELVNSSKSLRRFGSAIKDLSYVENNLDRLLQENEHFSLYLFPLTDKCQINTRNRADQPQSFLGSLREFVSISIDTLAAAWIGNLIAYTGLLPKVSSMAHSLKMEPNLVLESNAAFNRTIYHLHRELMAEHDSEGKFADAFTRRMLTSNV